MSKNLYPVEQVDREAADAWMTGPFMSTQKLAEAFAKHRIEANRSSGPDVERAGWDHRYRRLEEGEIIEEADEHMLDDGSWELTNCAGQKAPNPNYTSHRWYRRLKVVPAVADIITCQSTLEGHSASSTSTDARLADTKAGLDVERVARAHVMPGDPPDICDIALQWYLKFDFGYPHSVRESNIAVEGFKDGYRAAIASIGSEREAIVGWLRGQAAAGDKACFQAIIGSKLERDLAAGVVALSRAADAIAGEG